MTRGDTSENRTKSAALESVAIVILNSSECGDSLVLAVERAVGGNDEFYDVQSGAWHEHTFALKRSHFVETATPLSRLAVNAYNI